MNPVEEEVCLPRQPSEDNKKIMSNSIVPFSNVPSAPSRGNSFNNKVGVDTPNILRDEVEDFSEQSIEHLAQVSPLPMNIGSTNNTANPTERKSSFIINTINRTISSAAGLAQPIPVENFHNKRRRNRPFLTSSQLIDLFNRLDHNGDGSLDLEEFTDIIKMLKLQVTKEYIEKIFRNFKKESLSMQEFICAYQKVYSNQTMDAMGTSSKQEEEFIRATRYGVDEDGDRIFEVYLVEKRKSASTGDANVKSSRKITFQLNESREGIVSLEDHFNSAVEEAWEGGLEEINTMIHKDSVSNGDEGGRILWWIDITMAVVERTSIHKYVDTFGIPNNSKFLSNFSNFGSPLGKDPKSRFFVGNGVTVDGLTSSLNMFVQTAVLKDRPVVHLFPSWIENSFRSIENKLFQYLKDYYISRFAFILNLSGFSNTNKQETMLSYETAEHISQRLRDDIFDFSDIDSDDEREESKENHKYFSKHIPPPPLSPRGDGSSSPRAGGGKNSFNNLYSICNSKGSAIPLTKNSSRHTTLPTWIRSNAQLKKNKPQLKLDTLSMHLMDHGTGPVALITIRALDDEKHSEKLSLEEKSRCGILGRMLDSIWAKLLVINGADGAADIAGELDESPMTLMSFITSIVHSFSMKSMSSLDYWMDALEKEIKDMAVSKHSSHLAEMKRITKEFCEYVDPLLFTLTEFITEWEKETEKLMKTLADTLGEIEDNNNNNEGESEEGDSISPLKNASTLKTRDDRLTKMRVSILPRASVSAASGKDTSVEKLRSGSTMSIASTIANGSNKTIDKEKGRRRSSVRRSSRLHLLTSMHKQPSTVINSANSMMELEKLPLSYVLVKPFMGDATYRDLKMMIDGYELLDIKGLSFWREKIDKYDQRLMDMRTLISTQLEEKRNFTTFVLTIVTTLLAPLTILTGYFGMNFENMAELDPKTYPRFPGVLLMWGIACFLYIVMFVFSLHFRIIYSAT